MDGMNAESGILVVDKPRGPTSHDIVAATRRLYGTREVGHSGTLDPLATGVLVLLLGEATKLSAYLTAEDKLYRATLHFGVSTDTLDAEGDKVAKATVDRAKVSGRALEEGLERERSRESQIPPRFSAVKVGGIRAHKATRRGDEVHLAPRPVRVRTLDVVASDAECLVVDLCVSKGYYVRSFVRDLCEGLGVPGHLSALERRASGRFALEDAAAWPMESRAPLMSVVDAARRALPAVVLTESGERRARLGQLLTERDFASLPVSGPAAWISASGGLVAIGEGRPSGIFAVRRGFRSV
jgi:tRNA pseudouridine55 synthase